MVPKKIGNILILFMFIEKLVRGTILVWKLGWKWHQNYLLLRISSRGNFCLCKNKTQIKLILYDLCIMPYYWEIYWRNYCIVVNTATICKHGYHTLKLLEFVCLHQITILIWLWHLLYKSIPCIVVSRRIIKHGHV